MMNLPYFFPWLVHIKIKNMSTQLPLTFDHAYLIQSNTKEYLRVMDSGDIGLTLTTTPDIASASQFVLKRVSASTRERIYGVTRVYLTFIQNSAQTYATYTRQTSAALDQLALNAAERTNNTVYFRAIGAGLQKYALNFRLVPFDVDPATSAKDMTRVLTEADEVRLYTTHPLRGLNGVTVGLNRSLMTETDADTSAFQLISLAPL